MRTEKFLLQYRHRFMSLLRGQYNTNRTLKEVRFLMTQIPIYYQLTIW